MIAVVDYGLGNIKAFINVYEKLNIPVLVASCSEHLLGADKIILPGVGSFDFAMEQLNQSGMLATLNELVLNRSIPVLGICVGMQMLAKSSEEGNLPGLGWIDAEVKRLEESELNCIPHMGWNDVNPTSEDTLFKNLGSNARFYFLHSYYFHCNQPKDILAETNYGIRFTSAVIHKNIFGAQFHPEKSHQWGMQFLRNYAEI